MKESLPGNTPGAVGKELIIRTLFVDVDFAGDSLTSTSKIGFIVYCNGAPNIWLSDKQSSLETSSLGSKCVAIT